MRKFTCIFIFIFCFCGCAQLGYLKDPLTSIANFHQVDEQLWRGGQPGPEGLKELEDKGIKTIISFCGEESESGIQEKETAESMGMNFYNLPLSVYQRPSDEIVLSFLDIVLTPDNQPVFVHCSSGRDRTGAMVAVYRILVYDWTIKQAYQEAKKYGFWPYHGTGELHKMIHQIKDKPVYFEKAREMLNEKNH